MTEEYIAIIETARKVFVYANEHNWDGLSKEVFADKVTVDDSSYPGAPMAVTHSSARLVENWRAVFSRIQHSRHLLSNELVEITGGNATVHAFVTGIHVKVGKDGDVSKWTVYSTYDINLVYGEAGWRVTRLKQHYHWQEGHPSLIIPKP